jgi:hypothetical protein
MATLVVVPGNPALQQRRHDDDALPACGIVGVRCGWVVVVFVGWVLTWRVVFRAGTYNFLEYLLTTWCAS